MRQESLPLNNTPSTSSSSLDSTPIIESPLVQQVPIDLTVQEIQLEFLWSWTLNMLFTEKNNLRLKFYLTQIKS